MSRLKAQWARYNPEKGVVEVFIGDALVQISPAHIEGLRRIPTLELSTRLVFSKTDNRLELPSRDISINIHALLMTALQA